jgi:hypothetical protein
MDCVSFFIKKNSELFFDIETVEDKLDERAEDRTELVKNKKYFDSETYSQDMRDLVEIETMLKQSLENCSALITRLQESKQI